MSFTAADSSTISLEMQGIDSLLLVVDGKLTIDANTDPESIIADQLKRINSGQPIIVGSAVRSVSDNVVTVVGTVESLLGIANLPVTATGQILADSTVLITIRFTIQDSWSFSDTFPKLPPFSFSQFSTLNGKNLLDNLNATNKGFVLATGPSIDAITKASVSAGLNFVAECIPYNDKGSYAGILTSFISIGSSFPLSGSILIPIAEDTPLPSRDPEKLPWQLSVPIPGILLKIDLGINQTLETNLDFTSVALHIYSPTDTVWAGNNPTYPPFFAAGGILEMLSSKSSLDITLVGLSSSTSSMIIATLENFSLANGISTMLDLVGSDVDLVGALPQDLQNQLSDLYLDAINVMLGKNCSITGAGFSVKLSPTVPTAVLPGFAINSLSAHFMVFQKTLSLQIEGSTSFLGTPFLITLAWPEGSATAQMVTGASGIPLQTLFSSITLPDAIAGLTINSLEFEADIKGNCFIGAFLADAPWTLNTGPDPLTFSNIRVNANRSSTTGDFNGSLSGQISSSSNIITSVLSSLGIQNLPSFVNIIDLTTFCPSFDTSAGEFSFEAIGTLNIFSGSFPIDILIATNTKQKTFSISGSLLIGNSFFTLDVVSSQSETGSENVISGSWAALGDDSLNILDIIADLGFPPPPPLPIDIALTSVAFSYDFTKGIFTLIAQSKTFGLASFVSLSEQEPTKQTAYAFGLSVGQTINLSDLPLLDKLPSNLSVSIDGIEILISNGMSQSSASDANSAIETLSKDKFPQNTYPEVPQEGMSDGFAFGMNLHVGTDTIPVTVRSGDSQLTLSTSSTSSDDGTQWVNIQKTLGPLLFQKIGIRYQQGELGFLIDLSIVAGGLTISLEGLGIQSPLTDFQPEFTIEGIAVTLVEGPIEVSGGLLGSLSPLNFTGELILQCPPLTLAALGGYAELDGSPSLFIYATLDYPIGGPSFFFVTGIAAGIGFNRSLLIPDITGVAQFPLVSWAMGNNTPGMDPQGDIKTQVADVLSTLNTSGVIAPRLGEDWLALGVRFTSFEIIESFALVTVAFGVDFEFNVLGLSRAFLPDKNSPIVYAELAIKGSFSPSSGLLEIAGQLTPASYVFDTSCHLTGGFAYCVWVSGDHAGQFLMTMGGYSPFYNVPSYYPVVPRLGLNWQIDSSLTAQGDLYFALTSSAVMAGGGLNVVWSCGDIRAWLSVEADFLILFVPFHYFMDGSVYLGASFTIDLWFTSIDMTIHLGVDLEIWGPDFSGTARVDLSIISFTIDFGSSPSKDTVTLIEWGPFTEQLLPKTPSSKALTAASDPVAPIPALKAEISKGLLKKLSEKVGDLNYIVSSQVFELTVSSVIPLKTSPATKFSSTVVIAPDKLQPQDSNQKVIEPNEAFGIGPVGVEPEQFFSTLTVTMTVPDEENKTGDDASFWAVNLLQNIPAALWQTKTFDGNGVPVGLNPTDGATIDNALAGYKLVPVTRDTDITLEMQLKDFLFQTDEAHIQFFSWSKPTYTASDTFTASQTVASTIMAPHAQNNRPQFFAAMSFYQLLKPQEVDIENLDLLDEPLLRILGEEKLATTRKGA